ncbi:DMT family transporter [Halalkalibacter urbisdiaboli]|uniref:DMT family transporter n=1 Tax=Halalkalibacter urbisdiaboli TaxID=1960589 RepID=UPI001FD9BED8|nr:DMT family transporter [Halalkalibacter urbisdiaboli]
MNLHPHSTAINWGTDAMLTEKQVAYIKISLSMVIVGSSVVAGKVLVESLPVFLTSEIRFLLATLILIPLLIRREGIPSLTKQELSLLFLQAVSGVFLFSIFMLYGLKLTTAIEGGIITSTLPAIVAILAFLFLKETPSRLTIVSMTLAILGTLCIHMGSLFFEDNRGSDPVLGNLLILAAIIGEATFILCGKQLSKKVTPLTMSTAVSLFGAILFFPLALYDLQRVSLRAISLLDWGVLIYFGVIVTVIAFILMYEGVEKVPANQVGVLTSILPISTVILSFFILKERLYWFHLIAIVFVLMAIYITSKDSNSTHSDLSK